MGRIVVQKYGGSSVADLDRIRAVAERIAAEHRAGSSVVVVASAMGNTTNELIQLARGLSATPDRRELDMLISVGERITMALLAIALRDLGIPAKSLTGSQSGIITDESHTDARVVEVRADRVRQCLEAGQVVIVAGFQGVSREREVTTLGRGGSDTTAVVLAAALGAEHCEICSDVDGVWSADPQVVRAAIQRPEMSLDEALTLGRGGAKVLYEDAVRYARDQGVTIRATAAFGPGAGTRIQAKAPPRAAAVAVTADLQLIRTDAAMEVPGARLRRLVNTEAYWDIRNLHGEPPDGATPTAIVAAVGSGLGERSVRVSEGARLLAEAGIVVRRRGASGDEMWWEVTREQAKAAVQLLHQILCVP